MLSYLTYTCSALRLASHHVSSSQVPQFPDTNQVYTLHRQTSKWKPPTRLTILVQDYPRYGRYCTEYTQHDARFYILWRQP
jgi:hypothetical protein